MQQGQDVQPHSEHDSLVSLRLHFLFLPTFATVIQEYGLLFCAGVIVGWDVGGDEVAGVVKVSHKCWNLLGFHLFTFVDPFLLL